MLKIAAVVLLTLVGVFVVAHVVGSYRWNRMTNELRTRLAESRLPPAPRTVDFRELEGLPVPVQRYFRAVLTDGQDMLGGARVRHQGTFNMGQDSYGWKPFTSDQLVITRRPGFDWNATIAMMPALPARVHDAYVAGEGILHASVLGLITVADLRGAGAIAEGELMRFFAEAAWYPTVLLPSQGVRWEPIDERSARGTLTDGGNRVTLTFSFDEDGLIETVRADARGRTVDGEIVATPWQGRFWNYEERGGVRVPLDGEVAWLPPEGEFPYWRGHIEALTYDIGQ
jgi:hypothetical protein